MALDDFPIRDDNSQLSAKAEIVFEHAVVDAGQFIVQQRDRRDYGSDFQMEATLLGGVTNYRVHAQLKATDKPTNQDGSVSISVSRTNLHYMLSQPNSIYVCYHAPTNRLLVRSADDVFRDAEHQGEEWRSQDSVTIRFTVPFDQDFQATLRARTVASSTTQRNDRLLWATTPPDKYPDEVATNIPSIVVPESPRDAFRSLEALYKRGEDEVVSKAFEQFAASIGPEHPALVYAYLSEINLAMRRKRFSRKRVSAAIRFIENTRKDNRADALYCRANGHSALKQRDDAKRLYAEAIQKAEGKLPDIEAQCWKNLGTELEQEGDQAEANRCYEKALTLAPQLMEAHMALGIARYNSGDLQGALQHFEAVVWSVGDVAATLTARGYRLDVYFRLGMTDQAFDDIAAILPHGDRHKWIFPWCARLVYNYARTNGSSVTRAMQFWDTFVRLQPDDRKAQKERLLCLAFAKMHGRPVKIDFRQYLSEVTAYLAQDSTEAAYLWDRVGHWAQVDGDWPNAEEHYRKAYAVDPDRYGYCLGTALNFLKRFDEALPILLEQARVHQPLAMSWFQVATAQEGIGDISGCEESYRQALALEPDYALALFNLGGICWKYGPKDEAIQIWKDALKRFPSHPLAEKLREDLPDIFDIDDDR